jgi:hypothetical protein
MRGWYPNFGRGSSLRNCLLKVQILLGPPIRRSKLMDIINLNELKLLKEIFGQDISPSVSVGKWTASSSREYEVYYCGLCQCFSIKCLENKCYGTSCNGGGCDICYNDFEEFTKLDWKP